ncbi:MAG: phytanoyl-CoA dioxygenase family protein [Acidobacteriota bacterium]|nr:phytanoyl-CoA dioxygenase family protein [Acidobacteriota bacterium]
MSNHCSILRLSSRARCRTCRLRPGGHDDARGHVRHFSDHGDAVRRWHHRVARRIQPVVGRRAQGLGPDYKIVEIGFDVPLQGAAYQPWHRDFPAPRRHSSDAGSIHLHSTTTVDVTEDMGPFEVAVGTQWDAPDEFAHEMFPPKRQSRATSRAQRKMPKMGGFSARSALTIHRGTPNVTETARHTLVLGVDAPDARNAERHDCSSRALTTPRCRTP